MHSEKPFVIGIAGGTGSGKTTLAISLYKRDQNNRALLHLDDYFKKAPEVPILNGFINWEDPSSLRFDDLYRDLESLTRGYAITVNTKSELFNPDYNHKSPSKIPLMIEPKSIIIAEGYLMLHDPRIRALLDLKVFLDTKLSESSKRRSPTKDPVDEQYFRDVLEPMYQKTVEPTRQYADMIIDTTRHDTDEVYAIVESRITKS